MFPLKRISGFFLRCLLIYGLLIAPWPGLMDAYRACFRAGGNVLFSSFGGSGSVSFKPLSSRDHTKDTTLVLVKRRPPSARGELDLTSVYMGYRPTAFLVALVLATPIRWSRRWRALVWGLFWINVFVALRISLQLFDAFSDPNALALFSFSPFWKGLLKALMLVLVRAPATHYTAPMFVWLLVTFRRGDLATIFTRKE